MTSSFLWSTFAASSLLIGGLLTFWFRLSNKMLGLIMAFGSGVLISAVAFELAHDSVELSTGSGLAALGLFAGAIVFIIGDWFIGHMGGHSPEGLSRLVGSYLLPRLLGVGKYGTCRDQSEADMLRDGDSLSFLLIKLQG
jgi:zinc transporter, ZIP family